MKKKMIAIILFFLALVVEATPVSKKRIIALTPHITELLFAAGGGEYVVGVSRYSDYPAEAKKRPVIGDSYALDIEAIVSLQPDWIVLWKGASTKQIALLKQLGMPLFFVDEHRLSDIPRVIRQLGKIMETEKVAETTAKNMEKELAVLKATYADLPKVRVFYQIDEHPFFTVNGQHIISDALLVCGGINIFNSMPRLVASVGIEDVIKRNPDVIIRAVDARESGIQASLVGWQQYKHIDAVKAGNLFLLDANVINRATPRMVMGVKQLCETLHQARLNQP